MKAGRIPPEFLPIQSGVGNIANAVLGAMGANPDIPQFSMHSEVLQDSVIDLISAGKIKYASATSLTVTPAKSRRFTATRSSSANTSSCARRKFRTTRKWRAA